MNARCFSTAVIALATFAVCIRVAGPVAAQETAASGIAPVAPAPVKLSSGASDILKLSRAKVSDDVITAFVQNSDRPFNLTAAEIIYLRQEGVTDGVLAAMLNQSKTTAAPEASPQPEPPATTAAASAPQYVTPPTTTAFVETSPVSTVYVLPSTPTYYSFYDPWPYWYDPWPYWYPTLTFGFYWGGCYSGYWNNYCHKGDHPPPSHHGKPPPPNGKPPPPNGNPPPPNGNRPPPGGNSGDGGQPGTLVASGRPRPAATEATSSTGARAGDARSASPTPTARTTSYWSKTDNQPAASRAGGSQANAVSSRSPSSASPSSIRGSGTVNRSAVVRPNSNQGGDQLVRSTRNSNPTSVWTSQASQPTSSRPAVNQRTATVARPSRVVSSPATVWNRPASQPASRSVARSAAGYQRSYNPSSSYRSVGNAASFSRPSYRSLGSASFSRPSSASSVRSLGSSGSFRGGAGVPRPSSGGGVRGGGGGRHR